MKLDIESVLDDYSEHTNEKFTLVLDAYLSGDIIIFGSREELDLHRTEQRLSERGKVVQIWKNAWVLDLG